MSDTARYIEAPEIWNGDGPSVFLAGGITSCPDWQQQARQMFRNLDVTVINPRRADFPIGDPTAAPAQIAWEFDHLHRATAILFWFPASEGPQPIALYELGRYLALGRPLAVGCDPAYPRRQDVIEQVGLAAQDMPVWGNLSAACIAVGAAVASAYRAGQTATPDGEDEVTLGPGDHGKVSADDIAMVARATGALITSVEVIPEYEDDTSHDYLSTACLHGQHEHCRSTVNIDGDPKAPGTCKFCGAVCRCAECRHGATNQTEDSHG